MAEKLTINQRQTAKTSTKTKPSDPGRKRAAAAMLAGAAVVLAFSITQVARVSPKRGDVNGIVQELRKEHPKGSSTLPSRVDPTRGTKLWAKKHANG